MVFTFFYWVFIFFLLSIIGFFLTSLIDEKSNLLNKPEEIAYHFMVGFVFMTALSAYLSIFIPLNRLVFCFIVLIGIIIFYLNKRKIKEELKNCYTALPNLKIWEKSVLFLGFFCLIMVASGEIWVSDTKLYHAQNVQWIQQFGVVPGLGNFQPQLGYNNMFFPITAFFSQELPWSNQDFDALIYPFNGIVTSLLFLKILSFIRLELHQKDWWRACFYVLIFGFCFLLFPRGLSSPAPDYICGALTIYVFLMIEKDGFKVSIAQSLYLSGLIITAIIFKLSALFLGLLILPLLATSYTNKKALAIIGVSLLIGLPFLIRNYYLSGYLIFPFPAIDLFSPEWKIPNGVAEFEKLVITSWAKIPSTNPKTVDAMPFMDWFKIWWGQKDLIWKPLLLANVLTIFSIAIYLFKGKKHLALLNGIILINLLFWFANAPDPRFAFGFLFLGASLSLCSFLLLFDLWKLLNKIVIIGLFGLFIAASLFFHRAHIQEVVTEPMTWVFPKGLPPYKLIEKQTNFRYSMPVRPSTCHNAPLPCATRPLGYVVLRDSTDMQKGFKLIEKK